MSKRTSIQQRINQPVFEIPRIDSGGANTVTNVLQVLPHLCQGSFGIRRAEELFEVILDCLGVHYLFCEDQLLDLVFLF